MMRPDDIEDIAAVVTAGEALLAARTRGTGRAAADYRRAAGDLLASVEGRIADGTLGTALAALFPLAAAADVDRAAWPVLRAEFAGLAALTDAGARFRADLRRLALVEDVRAVSAVVFQSRDQANAERARLVDAFDTAILEASDLGELEVARALTAALGAAVRDIEARGRPLGRIVTYRFPEPMPSLVLAHRLYADAGRADEIAAMNTVRHPAFMPTQGEVLSL